MGLLVQLDYKRRPDLLVQMALLGRLGLKGPLVLLDLQVVQGRLVRGRLGRLVKANKVLLALLVFKVLLVLGDLPD